MLKESSEIERHDDERLNQLGIRRELRREFTRLSTLSFALGVLGTSASVASTVNTPILLGGPATAIWSWVLGSFGCLAISASVAELVSAYPTAGGVYTSTAFVVPAKYRSSVTFINAWVTLIGQVAAPASVTFALSQMIFAAVTISTDGQFVASVGQVLGLYIGLSVFFAFLNSLPTKFLHHLSSYYVWTNLIATLAVIIAIPAVGRGQLASSKFVWTEVADNSGWNSRGFTVLLGLFCVQWVMTDYDAAAHLSEEVKNAAITGPVAIFQAVLITAVLGFFVNVSLGYGVRDLSALPGPTGLVFSQILWDNLGKKGALAVWSLIIIVQASTAITCQLSCIRTIYAVSRDNALPGSKIFAKVWHRTKTPINATILSVVIAIALGLLDLASFVAVNAIFSLAAVALDMSYAIPTAAKVFVWLQNDPKFQFTPGPFYMGKWGYWVNAYAVIWTCIETGVLIMPQIRPVTASNMNYTGPIMGAVCGLSWIWYKLYWHRYFRPGGERITASSTSSESGTMQDESEKADTKGEKVETLDETAVHVKPA